jgi:hypothetical protein
MENKLNAQEFNKNIAQSEGNLILYFSSIA